MRMVFSDFVENLAADLERLRDAVLHLGHMDDVFWRVMAIIRDNPEVNQADVFQDWLAMAYADSMVVGIRRLVDADTRTVSLMRILEKVKSRAAEFTRAWFVGQYEPMMRSQADQWFTGLVGGTFSGLSRATVQAKQSELKASVSLIESYANEYVAHANAQPTVAPITFSDVRLAVVSAFVTLQWLGRIIKSETMGSPVPVIQSNWLKCFRVPWLGRDQPAPNYRHLNDLVK